MSRKDFILIAETIKNLDLTLGANYAGKTQDMAIQRTVIAEEFADRLADTNNQFKRDLFIQAATGVVPVNARKARV